MTNQPMSGHDMPCFAGPTTMLRLPLVSSAEGLDACFVGVPVDIGTANRSGTRYGPRQIRAESTFLRPYNMATRAAPYDSLKVADVGDVPINPYNLAATVGIIEAYFDNILHYGCRPLALGGDHVITLPIMRAMRKKHGPIGVIHIDAHADINDTMFGEKICHGTPFRRGVEEQLLDCHRVVQIGLRGTGFRLENFNWSRQQGFRVVQAEECWHRSLSPLMEEIRGQLSPGPVYISFDIDALEPGLAPGSGSPEIGGLTTIQVLEIIRGCRGLNIVGGDLVEVSPPYDPSGNTALVAAHFLYEMLCVLPGVEYRQ
jgi:guanidinobutyrase